MVFRGIFIAALAALPLQAHGQNSPRRDHSAFDPRALAARLGLPENSPEVQRLTVAFQNMKSGDTIAPPPPRFNPDLPVIRHFRETEGIALLGPALPPRNPPQVRPQPRVDPEKIRATFDQAIDRMFAMNSEVPPLPECHTSKTIRTPHKWFHDGKNAREETMLDQLFIRKGQSLLDPESTYGTQTTVNYYDDSKLNYRSLAAIGHGVTCLPYRIRVTTVAKYIDQGDNALKNYDGAAKGKGKPAPGREGSRSTGGQR